MVAGQQIWYVPFAGDWRDPRRWKNEMHRSPKGVSRALLGVGRLLPDPAVFGTNWAGHQLAADIFARRERWRILEAGAIASLLPPFVAGTPRALPPLHEDYTVRFIDNYLETSAELRAGLLFLNLGFRLVRDPVNAGRGRDPGRRLQPGPDWFAFRGRHAFGVEVICPRESDDILGRWQFSHMPLSPRWTCSKAETSASRSTPLP